MSPILYQIIFLNIISAGLYSLSSKAQFSVSPHCPCSVQTDVSVDTSGGGNAFYKEGKERSAELPRPNS